MIDKLTITNFKAFGSAEIRLAPYTLLSGLNSSGKSTVLQALALLRQSFDQGLLLSLDDGGFPLNGELTQLGTGQDVLHEDYVTPAGEQPQIGFQLSASNMLNEWQAAYGREDDLLPLTICSPTAEDLALGMAVTGSAPAEAGSAFTIFNEGFQYLRADRINPAVTYPRSHEMSVRRRFLGARGEYAIDFLRTYQDEAVTFEALLHGGPSSRLLDQTEAWMSEICPGVRMQARAIEQTDLVRLGFQFSRKGQLTSDLHRPTNVGFGLTYALPIVLACLTARPGSMILLENPEAHVHPQGQSAMGRLTCAAAAIGAQLVVETHSDHILNGVRLEVKRGALSPDDVALHYFRREDDGVGIVSPAIGADGMLTEWPEGFFDEWDRSLDQLLD